MPRPSNGKPTTSKSKPRKGKACSLSLSNPTSYVKQCQHALENCKKHGKARNTDTNYDGHIRRGWEWIHRFSCEEAEAEQHWKAGGGSEPLLSGDDDEETQHADKLQDPEFHKALDACPISCTPLAISMFLAFKCFDEDHGMRQHRQFTLCLFGTMTKCEPPV